jgi:predicted Fe-Mo cluster-binding NifX family protein
MKIAIAASENNLHSKVDPHFGRCNWFCIFDSDSQKTEFIENTARLHVEKAGYLAAELLMGKGIGIAIAGRFGSIVLQTFRTNKVQMIVPENRNTINEIINQIK